MNCNDLDLILRQNVAEVVFIKKTDGRIRKMVCTKSYDLLDSVIGRMELGYYTPTNNPQYNVEGHNNLIVWDIERKDFRTISCDTAKVTKTISADRYAKMLSERI